MSDLTDERLAVILGGGPESVSSIVKDMHAMATEIHRFRTCDRTAEFVALRKALHVRLDEVQKQAERIRQLEAAQAADEGRVRSVVREAIMDKLGDLYCVIDGRHMTRAGIEAVADAIAARAAKQLASAAPGGLPLWAKFAIQKMHDMVDQTDPDDPIGVALTRAGLEGRPE